MVVFIGSSTSGITLRSKYGATTAGGRISVDLSTAGVANGDMAVVFCCDGGTATPRVPTNWSQILSTSDTNLTHNNVNANVLYKICDGTETTINPYNGVSGCTMWVALFFTNYNGIYVAGDIDSQYTASNPTSQTLSISAVTPPLIGFGFAAASTSSGSFPDIAFSTASPAFDGTQTAYDLTAKGMIVGYKIYDSGPSNHTIDMNDFDSNANYFNMLASFYLRKF